MNNVPTMSVKGPEGRIVVSVVMACEEHSEPRRQAASLS